MGRSKFHDFLASGAPFVDFEVVTNAVLVEKMGAWKIGAHGT
jgi:hypothetical protein